ncbi:MAG TPA: GNAT family N-acetyltransferase [Stenotrophomonas sp.]|jgi:CelD/BcsL family acetyltransferase involved in cellulose biosynthesis
MKSSSDDYLVTLDTDPVAAIDCWARELGPAPLIGPFQSTQWLQAWYDTLGATNDVQPLLVSIRRRDDGRLQMGLPLLIRQGGGLRRIEFADRGVTDYAAPLLTMAPPTSDQMRAMYAALRRALPRADLLVLHKCASSLAGVPNPLLALRGMRRSTLRGHVAHFGEDFDAWRRRCDKRHRKGMERCWRVFNRHPGAAFQVAADPHDALQILQTLEAQQRAVATRKGWAYLLDQPAHRHFYRRLVDGGLDDGSVVLSTLTAEGQVIAVALGIRQGDYYALLRVTHAGDRWRHCSPGRLLIDRTMAAMHAHGVRRFDLTIGDYAYKQAYLPTPVPLYELEQALSWRGMPFIAYRRVRRWLAPFARRLCRPKAVPEH